MFFPEKSKMIKPENALKGRATAMTILGIHAVSGQKIQPPFAPHLAQAMFGLGCFWGAERKFWQLNEVDITAVGYSAGFTPNPTYQEVCSGSTGHNEVVLVVFDPNKIRYTQLLKVFWECHNPTQGMRQGNDAGTQYRSGIYTFNAQQQSAAEDSKAVFQQALDQKNIGPITTEIKPASNFYYAEDYHQQYLAKNPKGYCGLGGCGVSLEISRL
ncbi:MAG: peptide-methionine (S)-S-oxide reductase MsrA [Marinagarivorans sp.]|nr:peptide-methionine (S)-S-oxide reductase MsrA [Marinagarivorans sp.]